MSIITLTTDFGEGSPYVGAMKGVILAINPKATIVDITHNIPPQNVRSGAVVLGDVCKGFPPNTIHVVVVDPGVGTNRAIVCAQIGTHYYVAPDNGLLSYVRSCSLTKQIISVENPAYWLDDVSATFHGRDIMAPVAAHLSLGVSTEKFGPSIGELVSIDIHSARLVSNRIEGEIIDIDSFGNLITNITADMLSDRPTDERACIICNIYETWGVYHTYAEQLDGTLVSVIDSSGRLELAVVGDNAAKRLGIQLGDMIVVAWE